MAQLCGTEWNTERGKGVPKSPGKQEHFNTLFAPQHHCGSVSSKKVHEIWQEHRLARSRRPSAEHGPICKYSIKLVGLVPDKSS